MADKTNGAAQPLLAPAEAAAQIDARTQAAVLTWHATVPLTAHGVNLGDAMAYSVQMILGALWKQAIYPPPKPTRTPAAADGAQA